VLLLSLSSHALHVPRAVKPKLDSRREWIANAGQVATATAASLSLVPSAQAFDNAIPVAKQYADKPKRRGPKPTDLVRTLEHPKTAMPVSLEIHLKVMNGVDDGSRFFFPIDFLQGMAVRDPSNYGDDDEAVPALKNCKGAPNCFSTTGNPELDTFLLAPWKPPSGYALEATARDLEAAVNAYKPGQAGIDGAGFKIVASGAPAGQKTPMPMSLFYLYAQFESLKQGYIDDLEFAVVPAADAAADGSGPLQVLVRSSSRVGYLDYLVNAKRLNYLAAELREKGWTAPVIDKKSHQDYFYQNLQN